MSLIAVDPGAGIGTSVQAVQACLAESGDACEVSCARCSRHLCVAQRTLGRPVPERWQEARLVHLEESEYCRWCARPITAASEAKAPTARSLARLLMGLDRVLGRATSMAEIA